MAAREPQAFDTLYQRYAPYLRCFLQRRLPHPDLVDEICHDVLLVAWQRVARQHATTLPTAPAGDPAADPEVLLPHREQHQFLARAVAQLPPELRLVVEAAYYQATPYEAIATRLGCTVGTVQTRLGRARRQLRAALLRAGQSAAPV